MAHREILGLDFEPNKNAGECPERRENSTTAIFSLARLWIVARNGAPVEMRLDGKLSKEFWGVAANGLSVFMEPKIDLPKILWGHWLPHKDGKGEFIKQEIFGVPEAYATDIVMQFDMPQDQSAVLNACTHVRNGKRF